MNILVIEDSELMVSSIMSVLEGIGVGVFASSSGTDGLKKAEEVQPDIIFLDIMLPKLDGIQVLKELSSDMATRHIPVIILSVVESPADPGILRMAAAGFFKKPVDFNELDIRLKKVASGGRVLVAEDNTEILKHMETGLGSLGYEVLCIEEGEDVISSAKESRPDIILLDVLLPHEDGLTVLKNLKQDKETSAIPAMLFSGYFSSGIDLDEIAGADRFREQIFSVEDMAGEIKEIVLTYKGNVLGG